MASSIARERDFAKNNLAITTPYRPKSSAPPTEGPHAFEKKVQIEDNANAAAKAEVEIFRAQVPDDGEYTNAMESSSKVFRLFLNELMNQRPRSGRQ